MLALTADTSDQKLVFVISENQEVRNVYVHDGQRDHCKNIIIFLDQILAQESLSLAQFDAFGCIVGPGSFTGLRIGMIAMKTFCHIMQKPLLGVTTFERMVQDDHDQDAVYMWPAQRGCGYVCHQPLKNPTYEFVRFADFPNLDTMASKTCYVPEGFEVPGISTTCLPFRDICGKSLAQSVYDHFSSQQFLDVCLASPLYVQDISAKKLNTGP